MKGTALYLVDAAFAADVTMENYSAVPPIDAHDSLCPRANSLPRFQRIHNITNFPKAIGAYCGPSRIAPTYTSERQASCGINPEAANSPLVAVCAGAQP